MSQDSTTDPSRAGPPPDAAGAPFEQAAHAFPALWQASFGLWSAWAEAAGAMMEHRGAPAAQTLAKLLNPAAWPGGAGPLLDEVRDLLALPRFADLPLLDGSALPSAAPTLELMGVAQAYLAAAAPVWLQACQRFQEEAAARRVGGERLDSAGDALDLWNSVLDRTLMEFNRSAEFAAVQQRFLHAAMRQRQEVRRTAEAAAQAVDLPTRTEITDVYRRLHELLREVHALRRELRQLKQAREGAAGESRGGEG